MPTVQLSDQTLFYETHGPESGQPVLLMHGWLQIGRDLLILANALAGDGYRVILPDLPGYGRSVPPNRAYPPDFYRRDAVRMGQLLDTLGLRRVHIMGFSDGGEVALLMPILHPDLCRSVTAWGAIGAYPKALGDWVQNQMIDLPVTDAHRMRHPGQPVEQWQAQWKTAFAAIVAAGGDVSLSRAAEIRCPLLIMVGEHDALNPVASVVRFISAATHPQCRPKLSKVFAGAGHEVHEQRIDEFLETVRDFLQQV